MLYILVHSINYACGIIMTNYTIPIHMHGYIDIPHNVYNMLLQQKFKHRYILLYFHLLFLLWNSWNEYTSRMLFDTPLTWKLNECTTPTWTYSLCVCVFYLYVFGRMYLSNIVIPTSYKHMYMLTYTNNFYTI